MASTFTDLGIEIMATGENAGTWGDKTNTNLTIVNTAVAGYVEQAVTNGGTLPLTITDGAATATAQNAVIKLTGTITGNSIVTVPDSIEKTFIVNNGTSGAYTVQFKTVSGTGVTFSTTDKGTKFVYTDGTNINEISSSSSETLTSAGNLTLDATTDVILDAGGGDVFFKDDGTTFGSATNTSGNLIIKSGTTTALTFSGANVTAAGNLTVDGDLDVTGTLDLSDSNFTNVGSLQLDSIAGDGDTDTSITFSGSNVITVKANNENQVTFIDGAIIPSTDDNIDLGSSSAQFKDAYIDGTLEADAITIAGVSLAETISDTVGAMVSSNTETGITVAYQDGDNTLDFALGAAQTGITSITNTSLVVGRDADNDIDFATDNNIIFRAAGADQIVLKDGVLEPVADDDIALGTTGSKRFTNLFLSGAIVAGGGVTAGGNLNINGVFEIDVASGDPTIIFDTQGADKFHIAVDDSDSDNLVIKSGGTVGSGNGLKLDSSGNLTVTGEVQMTTLDIGGTNVAATAAELNIMDGNTSATSTTLADADRLVTNDNGTMVQVALSDVKTYLTSAGFSSEDPTALAIALG